MEATTYKPEKGIQLYQFRTDSHTVTLYYKGEGEKPLPHIASIKPKPKAEKTQPAPASYDSYGGWGGYGGEGYGYASYGYYNDWTGYTSMYSTVLKNQEGEDLEITFQQQDLEQQEWKSETASKVGAAMTAFIHIDQTDSAGISKLFDSALPSWKRRVEKGLITFILLFDKKNTTEEFVHKIANWIGAAAVVSADISSLFEYEKAREFFDAIAKLVTATSYPAEIIKRFTAMEAARFMPIENIQKLEKEKKISFEVDPVGNSLLHLALHNENTEVFFYLAEKFPHLVNHANMFNQTLISGISTMKNRNYSTKYFDWRKFWSLPFDFTNGLNNFDALALESLPLLVLELIRNKSHWVNAKEKIDRPSKLSQVLAALPLVFRGGQTSEEEALDALKIFIAEGASVQGEPIYKFVGCGFLLCTKYFVENGHTLSDRDIVHAFSNGWLESCKYVMELPEFLKMSKESYEEVLKNVVERGWNDILRKLAKKGIPLPLSANQSAWLSSANIIARANARIVLSLKDLCVNAMYEAHGEKNVMNAIEETPDEIKSLFLNSNRSEWVHYLKSEKKKRQLFRLYEALAQSDREENAMQLTVEGFTFSFKFRTQYSEEAVEMWVDGLSEEIKKQNSGQTYKYFYAERAETTSSLHTDEWTETNSDGEATLKKIMKAIGWDYSDAYVLINILFAHMLGYNSNGVDEIRCHDFVHRTATRSFHLVPAWYQDFIQQHFGLSPKERVYY